MNLENIELSEKTKQNLLKIGYKKLTSIQEKVIPLVLVGKDVIGQSRTGTGKTASFIIPVLEKLIASSYPQVLVLVPTRELALQVSEETKNLSQHTNLTTLAVYGGGFMQKQLNLFQRGVDVVVGTPGRIIDHLKRKSFRPNNLKFVILDEVDEMINKGFLSEIEWIIKQTPSNRQTLLFSATITSQVKVFSQSHLKDPQFVSGEEEKSHESNIQQYYLETSPRRKSESLLNFFRVNKPQLTIIFANTKRRVEEIERILRRNKIYCEYIHSGLSQARRNRVINKFRCQKIKTLIATDVAARGIHINDISHVINYDFPQNPEFYTHRIGRTGRAGASGKAITFLSSLSEKSQLSRIGRQKNYKIKCLEIGQEKEDLTKVVVAIIKDKNGRLLVSQRSLKSKISSGQWQNPGGKVEINESHEEALKREVKEETDMNAESISESIFRFIDKKNKFDIYFYHVEAKGEPKTKEPEKLNSEWIYMGIEEMREKDLVPALSEFIKRIEV